MNKDVPSYELCKQLKELGWDMSFNDYESSYCGYSDDGSFVVTDAYEQVFPFMYAPTIGEMMDVLPYELIGHRRNVTYRLKIIKCTSEFCCTYQSLGGQDINFETDKSLPNALAKMLIRCIKEGYSDLNSKDGNI